MIWTNVFHSTLIGSAACALGMLLLWAFATRKRDASSVDVAWAGFLGILAIAYALTGAGHPHRRLLIGLIGGVWGLRLAWHLLTDRVLKAREEDGRYQKLRADWAPHATRNFFIFFQAQGLLAALLAIPFAIAANTGGPLTPLDIAALLLWLIGITGESLADRQLAAWRSNAANKGKTCRAGLWNYSRHPNYFFEWLMWCAYALVATGAPLGFFAWAAPALMLFLILKVTGVPPTEARALKSRGDDYRAYQRTTSVFVPLPPKRHA